VALLVARETAAHGVAAHIDFLAGLEGFDRDGATQLETVDGVDAVLLEVTQQLITRLGQVALGGFIDELLADIAETELNGVIAVSAGGFELSDAAGASLDHGDRDGPALFIEELGHAQFLPKNADGHRKGNNASWTTGATSRKAGESR
jgi:hypothetical protein